MSDHKITFRIEFAEPYTGSTMDSPLPLPIPRVGEFFLFGDESHEVTKVEYWVHEENWDNEDVNVYSAILTLS